MRIIQFNSVGGASGDMILGCLIGLGADVEQLNAQLKTLVPEHFHIRTKTVESYGMNGITATVDIHEHRHDTNGHTHDHHEHGHGHGHHHGHGQTQTNTDAHGHKQHTHGQPTHSHANQRNFETIKELITASELPAGVKKQSIAVFSALADAEGKVHNMPPDKVHFHEVGAVDSIVDIVGCCLAMQMLEVNAIAVSPLPLGSGTMRCQHGIYPIPAPATVELLKTLPVTQTDQPYEMVTPTGAALMSTLPQAKASSGSITASANSFGHRQLNERPNLLRATIYETAEKTTDQPTECLLLESNIDDSTPEIIGNLFDCLFDAGALDVWTTAIQMKNQRPAVKLSLLIPTDLQQPLEEIIFRETTTFGIRQVPVSRSCLERRFISVDTEYGKVKVKVGSLNGEAITFSPEMSDCIKLSKQHNIAVRKVYDAAKKNIN
jgi:pyridinium-3,5-bisthiocarboxylic acid mononucleotide nickel chelatase